MKTPDYYIVIRLLLTDHYRYYCICIFLDNMVLFALEYKEKLKEYKKEISLNNNSKYPIEFSRYMLQEQNFQPQIIKLYLQRVIHCFTVYI